MTLWTSKKLDLPIRFFVKEMRLFWTFSIIVARISLWTVTSISKFRLYFSQSPFNQQFKLVVKKNRERFVFKFLKRIPIRKSCSYSTNSKNMKEERKNVSAITCSHSCTPAINTKTFDLLFIYFIFLVSVFLINRVLFWGSNLWFVSFSFARRAPASGGARGQRLDCLSLNFVDRAIHNPFSLTSYLF